MVGDVDGAAEDLVRAIPLLDRHGDPLLAAQARCDLARALLDADRVAEAAEAAEGGARPGLAGARRADGLTPRRAGRPAAAAAPGSTPDVHLAGTRAFTAAEAAAVLGETQHARDLAELGAGWHRRNGNVIAEAEAWQLLRPLRRRARPRTPPPSSAPRTWPTPAATGPAPRPAAARRRPPCHEAVGPGRPRWRSSPTRVAKLEERAGARSGRHADPDARRGGASAGCAGTGWR